MFEQSEILEWAQIKKKSSPEFAMLFPFLEGLFFAVPVIEKNGLFIFPHKYPYFSIASGLRGWGYVVKYGKTNGVVFDHLLEWSSWI